MSDDPVHRSRRPRSRRAIASYLSRVARALRRGEPVPADEDQTVTVDPATESELDIVIDRDGDTATLELEIEWVADENDIVTETNASRATFELYEDNAAEWRWRLRHRNGNIIADGGEGYTKTSNAEGGIESVRTNAPSAPVVDESTDEATADDDGSKATFELFADTAEEWRWRLRHDNGNIIADSGQGYSSKQKAKQGLRSVKRNVSGAAVEEVEG